MILRIWAFLMFSMIIIVPPANSMVSMASPLRSRPACLSWANLDHLKSSLLSSVMRHREVWCNNIFRLFYLLFFVVFSSLVLLVQAAWLTPLGNVGIALTAMGFLSLKWGFPFGLAGNRLLARWMDAWLSPQNYDIINHLYTNIRNPTRKMAAPLRLAYLDFSQKLIGHKYFEISDLIYCVLDIPCHVEAQAFQEIQYDRN